MAHVPFAHLLASILFIRGRFNTSYLYLFHTTYWPKLSRFTPTKAMLDSEAVLIATLDAASVASNWRGHLLPVKMWLGHVQASCLPESVLMPASHSCPSLCLLYPMCFFWSCKGPLTDGHTSGPQPYNPLEPRCSSLPASTPTSPSTPRAAPATA